MKREVELLAPAKNCEVGKAAINFGADAVYIGGPKFGARESAANDFQSLEALTKHAHTYGAKTFLALNTILFDHELEAAREQIWEAYNIGMDAVIIQDLGLLEMDLPPIALHASTQTNNYQLEKIQFMENLGFERIVLARELSLEQIQYIRKNTKVELEAFVHGALCVSLSGQCYLSQSIGNRSANRGSCAQPCRKKYDLFDAQGSEIARNKHLLSLKDMNQTASIAEMAKAGVMSFKIEGRLKDIDYVKNITSHYRNQLDQFLNGQTEFAPSTPTKTIIDFTPDPARSFSRGATDYFLHGRKKEIVNFDSPKSMGQKIGTVGFVGQKHFELTSTHDLANNDGLVFVNKKGKQTGIKVNTVENQKVFPDKMNGLRKGDSIYRNYSHQFVSTLKISKTKRKYPLHLEWLQNDELKQVQLVAKTENDTFESNQISFEEFAQKPERAKEGILRALNKTGDSPFVFESITFSSEVNIAFVPAKVVNQLRRDLLLNIEEQRANKRPSDVSRKEKEGVRYPFKTVSYLENISNNLAEQLYRRVGVEEIEPAFELQSNPEGKTLMVTAHCLKYQFNLCPKHNKPNDRSQFPEPWTLKEGNVELNVEFDCKSCMMKLKQK